MLGITDRLLEMQDEGYRDFQSKLIPTVDSEKIIGVRIPQLRAFAKEIRGSALERSFLSELPHKYYDENNLHGILISMKKEYSEIIYHLDRFLFYIDNWATCDLISPKAFRHNKKELIVKINEWMNSNDTYTVRFGIGMLLKFYLDENFSEEQAQTVAEIVSDEYYVNMMRAWYFATALTKQYDIALKFVEEKRLDKWTHNMTVRKATESYCITKDQKEYLRRLRIF